MTRRKREDRPKLRGYEVAPRDREIVFAVARMGIASTNHLRRLFFGDASTASRRLAKLVALHLLDIHAPEVNAPNLYTVGAKGVGLLEADDVDMSLVHRPRVRSFDRHLAMLNDVRTALVVGARHHPGVELVAFHGDLDLRRAAGAPPPAFVPDGIAELVLPHGTLALVVEVDTGSEARSIFAPKVDTTVSIWRSGETCWGAEPGTWRPAVFVPSGGRAKALARAIVEHAGGELWLVAEIARVRGIGIFGPVFATAAEVAATPRGVPVTYRGALVGSPREVP